MSTRGLRIKNRISNLQAVEWAHALEIATNGKYQRWKTGFYVSERMSLNSKKSTKKKNYNNMKLKFND